MKWIRPNTHLKHGAGHPHPPVSQTSPPGQGDSSIAPGRFRGRSPLRSVPAPGRTGCRGTERRQGRAARRPAPSLCPQKPGVPSASAGRQRRPRTGVRRGKRCRAALGDEGCPSGRTGGGGPVPSERHAGAALWGLVHLRVRVRGRAGGTGCLEGWDPVGRPIPVAGTTGWSRLLERGIARLWRRSGQIKV